MSAPDFPEMLKAAPGAFMSTEESRRATALAVVLELVKGRSVPIQVVERLARWVYNGEVEP